MLAWLTITVLVVLAEPANAQNFREWITPDRPIIDVRGVDVQLGEVNVTTE